MERFFLLVVFQLRSGHVGKFVLFLIVNFSTKLLKICLYMRLKAWNFRKRSKFGSFFWKNRWIFTETSFFSKSSKDENLLQNAYQMVFFLENAFSALMRFFCQKIRKLWTLEKLEKRMKCFREKKRFHLFKVVFYKNGKAQNMLVVAGRLVGILDPPTTLLEATDSPWEFLVKVFLLVLFLLWTLSKFIISEFFNRWIRSSYFIPYFFLC